MALHLAVNSADSAQRHMLRREKLRFERCRRSWFELGSPAIVKTLKAIWEEHRCDYDVRIVQLGLARRRDRGRFPLISRR
jgi:hypothetical protein